jgi:hypothetical protein
LPRGGGQSLERLSPLAGPILASGQAGLLSGEHPRLSPLAPQLTMTLSPPNVALHDLLQRNAYRILGLPGEAVWSEIVDAAERLRGRSWTRHRSPWDLPWLGPVRREAGDLDAALARLAEPDLRLLDRMFWFHDRDAEAAVAYLVPGSIRNALEGWSATSLPVARHDAAIVALVAASSLDAGMDDIALWNRTVRDWAALVENEGYWLAFMKAELAGGFERLASLGDVRDLRESVLGSVTDLVVSGAREALIAGKPGHAIRAVEMLRDELPVGVFEETCADLARVLGVGPRAPRSVAEPRVQSEPEQRAPIDAGLPWWASRETRESSVEPPVAAVPAPLMESSSVPDEGRAETASEFPIEPFIGAEIYEAPALESEHLPAQAKEPLAGPAIEPDPSAVEPAFELWWAARGDRATPAEPPATVVPEPVIEPSMVDQTAAVEPENQLPIVEAAAEVVSVEAAAEPPPAPWIHRPTIEPPQAPSTQEPTFVEPAPIAMEEPAVVEPPKAPWARAAAAVPSSSTPAHEPQRADEPPAVSEPRRPSTTEPRSPSRFERSTTGAPTRAGEPAVSPLRAAATTARKAPTPARAKREPRTKKPSRVASSIRTGVRSSGRLASRGLAASFSGAILQKVGVGILSIGIGLSPFLLLAVFANGSSAEAEVKPSGGLEHYPWVLEARIELNERGMAKLRAERAENDRLLNSLRQDLTESQSLLAEYQRRIEEGLPHDPLAYLRLQRYHDITKAQYQQVLVESRDVSERFDVRLRRRERLVAQHGEVAVR